MTFRGDRWTLNDKEDQMELKHPKESALGFFLFFLKRAVYNTLIYIYILSSRDVSDVHVLSTAFAHLECRAA